MRILFIHHHRKHKYLFRAGQFSRELVKRGHDITALCTSEKKHFKICQYIEDGVHYIESPDLFFGRARSGWDIWNIIVRILLLKKQEFDLIYAFETRPATIFPVKYLLKNKKTPLVIDWADWWGHGGLILENRPRWYQLLFGGMETYYEEHFRNLADGTVVISTGLISRAIKLGVDQNTIVEITNGAVTDGIKVIDSKTYRKQFAIPQASFVICDTGKDVLIGNDLLFKAFKIVLKSHSDVFFLMTGSGKKKFDALASEIGMDLNFKHLGFLPSHELQKAISCADVFVIPFVDKPSNLGRWPGKIGKYLSQGRPIISNPVGVMKSLLKKHQIGLLADETPEDMAEKILFLRDNPKLCNEFGYNARKLAENDLNWSKLTDKLELFFETSIQRFRDSNYNRR